MSYTIHQILLSIHIMLAMLMLSIYQGLVSKNFKATDERLVSFFR